VLDRLPLTHQQRTLIDVTALTSVEGFTQARRRSCSTDAGERTSSALQPRERPDDRHGGIVSHRTLRTAECSAIDTGQVPSSSSEAGLVRRPRRQYPTALAPCSACPRVKPSYSSCWIREARENDDKSM
jgi:hypothetical protein